MKPRLNRNERKILDSLEKGEWKKINHGKRRSYGLLAARQLKQERVNIRISSKILKRLREAAAETGLPYQTLISSILYRYALGMLHDEKYILETIKMLKKAA